IAAAQSFGRGAQKCDRFVICQIADGGTREEPESLWIALALSRCHEVDAVGKVANHRHDIQSGKAGVESLAMMQQKGFGDIDRQVSPYSLHVPQQLFDLGTVATPE